MPDRQAKADLSDEIEPAAAHGSRLQFQAAQDFTLERAARVVGQDLRHEAARQV